MNMVSIGETEVQEVSVEDADLSDVDLPKDNEALFEQIKNDPDVQTADMEVQGDWTFGAIADRISMEERVNNVDVDWQGLKQVNWAGFKEQNAGAILSQPNTLEVSGSASSDMNSLAAPGSPQPYNILDDPAPAPDSGFAAGDPGIGTPATKTYRIDGRAGNDSAVTRNGDVILSASAGTRAIAFNPPGDADFLQLINRFDWGHQARAVLEALTGMAGLGGDSEYKVPAFDTESGTIAFVAPYQYSFARALGVTFLQTTFDMKMSDATAVTFALRQPNGEVLAETDVDVSEGGQSVTVTFISAPPNGVVTVDSGDTALTIANTEVFPPV